MRISSFMIKSIMSLAIVVLMVTVSFSEWSETEDGMFLQLRSEDISVREAAVKQICLDREKCIQEAECIIRDFVDTGERRGTVKSSIKLLGKLQSQQSVPLLVEHLTYRVYYKSTKRPQTIYDAYPCVQALGDIGLPSVKPLIDEMKKQTSDEYARCAASVLCDVLGKEDALSIVNGEIDKTTDAEMKVGLTQLMEAIGQPTSQSHEI